MKKENNKKIYITTGGNNMGEDEFKKLLNAMTTKTWTKSNPYLYTSFDTTLLQNAMSYLMDEGKGDSCSKKEKNPEINDLDIVFEKLDSEEIDNVLFWYTDHELELHTEGKKPEKYTLNIPEMDAEIIARVIKSYLNKNGNYIVDGMKNKLYAFNVPRADPKGFPEDCFDSYKDSNTVRIHYKTKWYTVGKKKLAWIFELFPDVKVYWIKLVKKEVDKARKMINAVENHPVYTMTDEDRLLMEVMDD